MKRFPITSGRLFKGTVLLLGIPAVFLLVITVLFVFVRLISTPIGGGIGSFTFAITRRELVMSGAIMVGVFLLVCFLGAALVRRHKRRDAG